MVGTYLNYIALPIYILWGIEKEICEFSKARTIPEPDISTLTTDLNGRTWELFRFSLAQDKNECIVTYITCSNGASSDKGKAKSGTIKQDHFPPWPPVVPSELEKPVLKQGSKHTAGNVRALWQITISLLNVCVIRLGDTFFLLFYWGQEKKAINSVTFPFGNVARLWEISTPNRQTCTFLCHDKTIRFYIHYFRTNAFNTR